MTHKSFYYVLIPFFTFIPAIQTAAQAWDFIKEKNGIKIYTRLEAGKSLKSYKGVTEINAPVEKVFSLMEDISNTDWWDKKLTHIRVLLYEKDKRAQYYMVYDLPWPVMDRDLCVDVTISSDTKTGERMINAVSLNGVIPLKNDMVRITDYRQTWTIIPDGNDMTLVTLEGFVDPAGTMPDWISNMLIVESPMKAINGLKEAMRKK